MPEVSELRPEMSRVGKLDDSMTDDGGQREDGDCSLHLDCRLDF